MSLIQIRNVPTDVHRTLKARAARAGLTLSDYVLRELEEAYAFTPLVRTPRDLPRRLRISCGPLLEYLSTLRCGPRKSFVGPEALLASSRQLSRRAT